MKIDHHQTICVKHNISPVGRGDCGVAVADEAETVLATIKHANILYIVPHNTLTGLHKF